MLSIYTIRRKANEAGYSLRKGFQKWHNPEWGYVEDIVGDRVVGYEIFDYQTNYFTDDSYTELYDHALTFEEAIDSLRILCAERGVIF